MSKKVIFEGKSILKKITYDKSSKSFYFDFKDIYLIPTEFWRLYQGDKIRVTSFDQGKKYTQNKPEINLITQLYRLLEKEILFEVSIVNCNDLVLKFTGKKALKVYVNSMAFENWEIRIRNSQYICLQGGNEIAVFN